MPITELGLVTHHSRVERWECDYNNHWNTRFYGRSFQLAAETIAVRSGGINPGAATTARRHIRFVGELFVSAPIQVRSAVVEGGAHDGAILHLLSSRGKLAASALDWPGTGADALPRVAATALGAALPRGLDMIPADLWSTDRPEATVELGPTRPHELDHTGTLTAEEVLRRFAISSHDHMARMGYTTDYVDRTSISRMTVELRVALHQPARLGEPLRARARLAHVGGKSFATAHRLETPSGALVAAMEQNLLAVDLKTRKAVAVPDFLRV